MPIRPEMRGLYPANWKEIRARILARSGGNCECVGQCGDDHTAIDGTNGWDAVSQQLTDRCWAPNRRRIFRNITAPWEWVLDERMRSDWIHAFGNPIRVVLTIAHLVDKNPANVDESNLGALCQRCHLKLDLKDHVATARATREAKAGQGRLF